MTDPSYWSAIVKDLKFLGLDILFRYLEHKSNADREAVKPFMEPYMKAFENLTEALIKQPEHAEEILKALKELYDLREIILLFITPIS